MTHEHGLYFLNEEKFNLFLASSEMHKIEDYVSHTMSVNSLDSHAIVLHIWCLLNEDELRFYLNMEKMMPYSIDHYILKLLRSNKKIKQFLQLHTMDQGSKFVLAYYLACATLQWGDAIILEHEQGQALCETNNARDYFLLAEEEDLNEENHAFYSFQKTIVHLMASDFSKTDRLNRLIKEALQLTRQYLSTHTKIVAKETSYF